MIIFFFKLKYFLQLFELHFYVLFWMIILVLNLFDTYYTNY